VLKPWARAVVTAWVVVVVPVLLGTMALMVLALPRVVGTAVVSLQEQAGLLADRFGAGDVAGTLARSLAVVAIGLPVLGAVYLLARVVRQVVAGTWRRTRGRPGRRALAGVVAAALVAGLAWAWWPDPGAYRPIQAYERGALTDALPAGLTRPAGSALAEGRVSRARTTWPEGLEVPTADAPALAVVMVPRTGGSAADGVGSSEGTPGGAGPAASAPTWVFPFNRPLPPGEGDNQALAVNTTDGSTAYDVAFALVYADEGSALNTNEAYALASCTGCTTVAVAFQVVLVLGQADVVVPQNLSGAVNYACIQCVTYALATQLVLTVSGPLGNDTTARLEELWEQIEAFAATIEDVPLSELQARLSAFEAQILGVVRADPAFVPPASRPAPTGTGGATGAPGGGATDPTVGGGTASPSQPAATGGGGPGTSAPPAVGTAPAEQPATTAPAAPAPATTTAPAPATTATAPPEPSATPSEAPATTAP
jgi:putative peptide zinc metalloprotease protein